MKPLTFETIASFSDGKITAGDVLGIISGVSTDTRTVKTGDIYVALAGERFDGHSFLEAAAAAGAAAVMVSSDFEGKLPDGCGVIRVFDTLVGLQCLARRYREHLGLKVVAITGSNGKTSTKDLIAGVLSQRFTVSATKGNLNNHIGLPLTILSTDENHECGVWEMGMSHPGEIEVLADIGQANVGVITNVGTAHIEHMKSREAIAEEKGMLAESISGRGCVVLNGNDDYSPSIAKRTKARAVMVGREDMDEIYATNVRITADGTTFTLHAGQGSVNAAIPVPGAHMVSNALLAAAVGLEFGLGLEAIATGLASVEFTGGRLQRKNLGGILFIDDSYNANPDSMKAAVDTFAALETKGRKFVIAGAMAELGDTSEAEHIRIGKLAAHSGVNYFVSVGGELARSMTAGLNGSSLASVSHFDDQESCAAWLKAETREGDMVLVKGSRSSAMEKVIEAFSKDI